MVGQVQDVPPLCQGELPHTTTGELLEGLEVLSQVNQIPNPITAHNHRGATGRTGSTFPGKSTTGADTELTLGGGNFRRA